MISAHWTLFVGLIKMILAARFISTGNENDKKEL
jgi:hypothetical protein